MPTTRRGPPLNLAKKRARRDGLGRVTLGTDFGGLESPRLALLNVGYSVQHLFTSETDPHCVKLSECLYKDIRIRYNDIKERDNTSAPHVDVYCAGVPCCSWASNGPRSGMDDTRGELWAYSLAYVIQCKPKLALFECAPTLMTWKKFRPVLDGIVRVLEQAGYTVEKGLVDSQEHGLPQHRSRTYLLAFWTKSIRSTFQWPQALASVVPLASIIRGPIVSCADMLPTGEKAKLLVEHQLRKVAADKIPGPNERIIVELNCTIAWSQHAVGKFPCITASRAQSCDWWVVNLGRKVTLEELMMLQGFSTDTIDYRRAGVSRRRFGHMIGNSMSMNVLERLLPAALLSVGFPSPCQRDRWEELVS